MATVSVTLTDSQGNKATKDLIYTLSSGGNPRPSLVVPGYAVEKFYDDFKTFNTASWTKNTGPLGAPREEYNQAANVTIGPEGLEITAKREAVGGKQITSGYVTSAGKVETGPYALYEAEITMPKMSANAAGTMASILATLSCPRRIRYSRGLWRSVQVYCSSNGTGTNEEQFCDYHSRQYLWYTRPSGHRASGRVRARRYTSPLCNGNG